MAEKLLLYIFFEKGKPNVLEAKVQLWLHQPQRCLSPVWAAEAHTHQATAAVETVLQSPKHSHVERPWQVWGTWGNISKEETKQRKINSTDHNLHIQPTAFFNIHQLYSIRAHADTMYVFHVYHLSKFTNEIVSFITVHLPSAPFNGDSTIN